MLEFKSITMMELRGSPGEIIDQVYKNGEAFVVERNGQQMACLVPISVFFPDIKKSRLHKELSELFNAGEKPKITFSDNHEVEMRFDEKVNEDKLTIKIILPHGYPNTAPKLFASPIDERTPHRWNDGALCIFGILDKWNPGKHTVKYALELARQWLETYSKWQSTGNWE